MGDFQGMEAPEMIKTRPVVVLRRSSQNSALVAVIPLSTTRPQPMLSHHVELMSPIPSSPKLCWAKCDMVYTLAIARLDRFKVNNRQTGKREYVAIPLAAELFAAIQNGVRSALGL